MKWSMRIHEGHLASHSGGTRRGHTLAKADPSDTVAGSSTMGSQSNPLNMGPCGSLFGGSCWVSQTLMWATLVVGIAAPFAVLLLGNEV